MAQVKLLNRGTLNLTSTSEFYIPLFVNASENGYIVKVIFSNQTSNISGGNILLKTGVTHPLERYESNSYDQTDTINTFTIPGSSTITITDIYVPANCGIYTEVTGLLFNVFGIEYPAE
jgi:hypothetical protein